MDFRLIYRMVRKITVKKVISDDAIASCEGEYFNEDWFTAPIAKGYSGGDTILREDSDVYTDDGRLLLKFRKNVISKALTDTALRCYRKRAKVRDANRGAAAGILDIEKLPHHIQEGLNNDSLELFNTSKFRTELIVTNGPPGQFASLTNGNVSRTRVSNLAPSNIAGYFDVGLRGNGSRRGTIPCRLTSFTQNNPELWNQSLPFLQRCDELFQQLVPERHHKQWIKTNLVPEFAINNTAFSTVTLNYSWRTALHRDAGDFKEGFGNLIVIEDDANPNRYEGCYIGFPQYKIAVDVRTGDFLAMDVHEWHCNTEFVPIDDSDPSRRTPTRTSPGARWKSTTLREWRYNRLSIVCYLRDNMIKCRRSTHGAMWQQKSGSDVTQSELDELEQKYHKLYRSRNKYRNPGRLVDDQSSIINHR